MSAHFDMEIHDDEFQSGVPADKQPTVSDGVRGTKGRQGGVSAL